MPTPERRRDRLDPDKLELVRQASIKAVTKSARTRKGEPKLAWFDPRYPQARRVMASEQFSHSQIWSRHAIPNRLVNRWDDLEGIRRRLNPPRIFRYQSEGLTVRRVIT